MNEMSETVVVKIGGGAGIDLEPVAEQIAQLVRTGARVVVVHGGSNEATLLGERLGHPPVFITSPSGHESRRTDAATMDIFQMAVCGKINPRLVTLLRAKMVDAVGLSGLDGGTWIGSRKGAIRSVEDGRTVIIRDDLSGRVERVNGAFLAVLLESGMTPVLSPPALSTCGSPINVDADRAAAATAAAIGADELLLLSNVPGVLADPSDASSLIERGDDLDAIRNAANGRMKNKVLAAEEAVNGDVRRVVIGDARGVDAVARARSGAGTVFEGAPA